MLKKIKISLLSAADGLGVSRLALSTSWRKNKLLILCYHGISLEDEHRWEPGLYMAPELLRKRFEHLRNTDCQVLPFKDAVRALYAGELPPRAVAITFDDGFHDFYQQAVPLANEFGFPLTVYLTTYYSYFNRPVFDPALNYILWRARGQTIRFREVFPESLFLSGETLRKASDALYRHVVREGLSGEEKNAFLERVASAAKVDFQELCRKRLLHLMSPQEVALVTQAGADVQLHTHRHRVSAEKFQFQTEIAVNREKIEEITHQPADHFCYPSGFVLPSYIGWLKEMKVQSATTCVPGIATRRSSPLLLPRLVDSSAVTDSEFGAWVSGLASLLPKWKFVMDERSYLDGEINRAG